MNPLYEFSIIRRLEIDLIAFEEDDTDSIQIEQIDLVVVLFVEIRAKVCHYEVALLHEEDDCLFLDFHENVVQVHDIVSAVRFVLVH